MEFEDSELDYLGNDSPICPYCDYVWEWDGDLLRGGSDEIVTDCPHCGKEFCIVPNYSITYNTHRIKPTFGGVDNGK
jgi:uncharacterized Zn-finger protein